MKYQIAVAFLFSSVVAYSQKTVDGLAKAERSFAAYAVSHGIKPAFLEFADSMGIMFDKARPVNAIQLFNAKENRPGILNWRPEYVEIAASHDFGYTTGPWTFQPNTLQDSITGRGRFITVWHINNNGEWKFLVDLGVTNIPASADTVLRKIEITDPASDAGNATNLLEAENAFIQAAKQSSKEAYNKFLSAETILNRVGVPPAKSHAEITLLIENSPKTMELLIDGSGIASSGDLGYVYGTSTINGKTDNYLHIWRKEKAGWKLALEVLRF